jgi:dihydroorotase
VIELGGVRLLGGDPTDVRIADGLIAGIGTAARRGRRAERRIGAEGLVMLPAFVDLHAHLREPGGEDSETIATGTRAAAAGGYSDVFAMANCSPVTDDPQRVRHIARIGARDGACRVHPVGAITVGLAGRELAPIATMARAGARMFSDDGHCVEDPALLHAALCEGARHGAVVAQHAQCGSLAGHGQINAGVAASRTGLPPWPAMAEETIVARDVILAGDAADTGARLHVCHLSTAGAVDIVRWAKRRGWPVTAEVTPHHLLLTDDEAISRDTVYKVNPPLRAAADVAALRAALRDGTIDVIATDHAPHTARRKDADWCHAPFGMIGLETALSVAAEVLADHGEADWALIAALMSHRPAQIGGVSAFTGRPLRPGEPATFTLVDPEAHWTIDPAEGESLSRNTPFAGGRFRHRVVATVVDGQVTSDLNHLFSTRDEENPR